MSAELMPVILDTDIGSDIDDTWALGMLLRCAALDLKFVTSAASQPQLRARLAAKLLEVGGRTDVPIGVGLDWVNQEVKQAAWVEDYPISRYPGVAVPDGVGGLVQTIAASERPMTLICIGPLTNIAAALECMPQIAQRTHFVGMHGSVFRGYGGSTEAHAEFNVRADVKAAQKVFTAPWKSLTITPLDTCGLVKLRGDKYLKVRNSADPVARAIVENYDLWRNGGSDKGASSTLYDTVAVYLAFSRECLEMKRMGIRVTDDGFTVPDENRTVMDVAVAWRDLEAFEDLVLKMVLGEKA